MRYLTAAEIAALYRLPVERIYWLARRDNWRRTTTKPRGYWADDVEHTMRDTSTRVLDNS